MLERLRARLHGWDLEPPPLPPEEEAWVQALMKETMEDEYRPKVFSFAPRRTALFASFEKKRRVNCFNRRRYFRKILLDAAWLMEHGYRDIVVDCGTDYGYLAMQILIEVREAWGFTIFALRQRERRSTVRLREWKRHVPDLLLVDFNYGSCDPREYQEMMKQISVISNTKSFLLARRRLPQWLLEEWGEEELPADGPG